MVAGGFGRIIDEREDFLVDFTASHQSRASRSGAVGDAIDTRLVKSPDPDLQAALRDGVVREGQLESASAKHEEYGIEPFLGAPIWTAGDGDSRLLDGTGFRIGKLTGAADDSFK